MSGKVKLSEKSIRIDVDGRDAAGDLVVSGFASVRTALEVGAEFADALRRLWPDATVRVFVNEEPDPGVTTKANTGDER